MKSKKPIVIIIISVVIVIGLAILSICIKTKLHNQKIEMEIRAIRYDMYCEVLCMERYRGEDFDDPRNIVPDAKPNEQELNEIRIKVAYYNLEMGEDLTVEEVLESFYAFLAGDEEGSKVVDGFRNSFYNGKDARIGSEDDFRDAVDDALDIEGEKISTASEEQIEAAIQYVIEHPELVK